MNSKLIAIAAVVIIVGAAAGVVIYTNNNDSNDDTITVVDGANKTIKLDKPLEKVCVINSNIPKAMLMLGLEKSIKCWHWSTDKKKVGIDIENDESSKLGTYYTPSVEKILSYDVDAVLCPVSSMTPVAGTEKSLKENGIEVIRLDCNGTSILDDIHKLSILFGEPESAKTALSNYMADYNAMLDAIKNAVKDKEKLDYLYGIYTESATTYGKSVFNHTSAISETVGNAFGKNVTSYTDLSTKGVSNTLDDGTIEALSKVQDKIDVVALRVNITKDADVIAKKAYDIFVNETDGVVTDASPAKTNGKIFVINTNLASGLYGHIGVLLFASKAYGIEVDGYSDFSKVIKDFQEKYHIDMIAKNEAIIIEYNSSGEPTTTTYKG